MFIYIHFSKMQLITLLLIGLALELSGMLLIVN